jgi:hypothetical protein
MQVLVLGLKWVPSYGHNKLKTCMKRLNACLGITHLFRKKRWIGPKGRQEKEEGSMYVQ